MVTSPSACKRWLQQLVSRQPIKLVLHLLFEFCVQPCNQTPSSENLAGLGREPIIPLLHAYNLALAGLAPWCEPGSARKTTNQALWEWECARAASGISDTTAPVVGREARPRPKPHPVIHTGVSWLASLAG